jgi:hypothetical protein
MSRSGSPNWGILEGFVLVAEESLLKGGVRDDLDSVFYAKWQDFIFNSSEEKVVTHLIACYGYS